MQLALLEARAGSGEEGEIGTDGEGGELPPPGVVPESLCDGRDQKQRGECSEGCAPRPSVACLMVDDVHDALLARFRWLTLIARH